MACNRLLDTQSFFDAALVGDDAREAEEHIGQCPECAQLLKDLEAIRQAIRRDASYHRADPALKARVLQAIEDDRPQQKHSPYGRPFFAGAASGAVAATAAAALAFLFLLPAESDEIAAGVAAAHQRSLMPAHLVELSSHDPARVQAWLSAHDGISPPVKTLGAHGFTLEGARSDYIYEGPAGAAVYRHGKSIVNLFAWTAKEDEPLPASARSGAVNIVFWREGHMIYCAASEMPVAELAQFAALIRGVG